MVQEAFANTAAAISQGKEIRSLEGWLNRCVYNTSISHVERKKAVQPLMENFDLADPQALPEIVYTRQRRNEDMCQAIDKLAPDQRLAFLLAEIKGLGHNEVANIMERSKNSVRQLLTRARRNIREAIGPNTPTLAAPAVDSNFLQTKNHAYSFRDFVAAKLARFQDAVATVVYRSAELGAQPAAALITGAIMVGALGTAPTDKPVPPIGTQAIESVQQSVAPHAEGEVVSYVGELLNPVRADDGSDGSVPTGDSRGPIAHDPSDGLTNRTAGDDNSRPSEDTVAANGSDSGPGSRCEDGEARQADGTCRSTDGARFVTVDPGNPCLPMKNCDPDPELGEPFLDDEVDCVDMGLAGLPENPCPPDEPEDCVDAGKNEFVENLCPPEEPADEECVDTGKTGLVENQCPPGQQQDKQSDESSQSELVQGSDSK